VSGSQAAERFRAEVEGAMTEVVEVAQFMEV